MKADIRNLDGSATIDISQGFHRQWSEELGVFVSSPVGDEGGYCHICRQRFNSVFEAIDHFIFHEREGEKHG